MALDLDAIDPVELAAALSRRPPTDALVAAARAAVDVSDARWERDHAMAEAGTDVAAARPVTDRDAQQMWHARARTDGADSRAAEKATELATPLERETPEPYESSRIAEEAREWADNRRRDQEDRDRDAEDARASQAAYDAEHMALWERAAEDDDADVRVIA